MASKSDVQKRIDEIDKNIDRLGEQIMAMQRLRGELQAIENARVMRPRKPKPVSEQEG